MIKQVNTVAFSISFFSENNMYMCVCISCKLSSFISKFKSVFTGWEEVRRIKVLVEFVTTYIMNRYGREISLCGPLIENTCFINQIGRAYHND